MEGWITLEQTTEISVIEHGWCESGGQILDPSIVLVASPRLAQSVQYFPGVQHDRAEWPTLACRDLPLVRSCGQYGMDGRGHSAYQAAYEAAYAQALLLASASSSKLLVVHPSVDPATEGERRALVVQAVSSHDFWTHRQHKKDKSDA